MADKHKASSTHHTRDPVEIFPVALNGDFEHADLKWRPGICATVMNEMQTRE